MYWIEVDFDNGKTLRKEHSSLNETFKVYARYTADNRSKPKVLAIRAGRNNETYKNR